MLRKKLEHLGELEIVTRSLPQVHWKLQLKVLLTHLHLWGFLTTILMRIYVCGECLHWIWTCNYSAWAIKKKIMAVLHLLQYFLVVYFSILTWAPFPLFYSRLSLETIICTIILIHALPAIYFTSKKPNIKYLSLLH